MGFVSLINLIKTSMSIMLETPVKEISMKCKLYGYWKYSRMLKSQYEKEGDLCIISYKKCTMPK